MNQPPGPPPHAPIPGQGAHDPQPPVHPHWIPHPPAHPGHPHLPPPPARAPDPGSRLGALIAKLIAIPLLLFVAFLQQYAIYFPPAVPENENAPAVVAPDSSDQGLTITRMMLKVIHAWPSLGQTGEPLTSLDGLWRHDSKTPDSDDPDDWALAMEARTTELRAALVAGERQGPQAALDRLDALNARMLDDGTALAALVTERLGEAADDIDWTNAASDLLDALRRGDPEPEDANADDPVEGAADDAGNDTAELRHTIADSGEVLRILTADSVLFRGHYLEAVRAGGPSDALDDDTWEALIERHGWYAQLARTVGRPDTDPDRAAMLSGGAPLLGLLTGIGALFIALVLGSIASIIYLLVRANTRRMPRWFVPPLPGGSVYLETVALFILAFLGTQIVGTAIASLPGMADFSLHIGIGLQWLVLLVIFWPLARGVSVARWRRDLGLIAPRGIMREIGAGFVAYLAFLPLLALAMGLGLVLKALQDTFLSDYIPPASGENPVLEIVTSGDPVRLILLYTMATIWAPLVEEIVFRGCLYRHLRSRIGFLAAAALSALAFGLMHGYELVLLGGVIALGISFSFIREWRGSLVGAIVMHALHNGTLLAIMIAMLTLAG